MRVLVAEPSLLGRTLLREALADCHILAEVPSGEATYEAAVSMQPDVILLAPLEGRPDALATISLIMAQRPTPILFLEEAPGELSAQALRRGAVAVAPRLGAHPGAQARLELRQLLQRVARVPVIRHPSSFTSRPSALRRPRIIGIGASTGGPEAVAAVLERIPSGAPLVVLLVQHLSRGFTAPFARFLAGRIALPVSVVTRRTQPEPGHVYLPPEERHLVLEPGGSLVALDTPPLEGHRPSATVLLESLAQVLGERAVGVLLTGMGEDGVAGLVELARRGALTIAQDQSTSTIYGMPQEAARLCGALRVLPLHQIARELRRLAGEGDGGSGP